MFTGGNLGHDSTETIVLTHLRSNASGDDSGLRTQFDIHQRDRSLVARRFDSQEAHPDLSLRIWGHGAVGGFLFYGRSRGLVLRLLLKPLRKNADALEGTDGPLKL